MYVAVTNLEPCFTGSVETVISRWDGAAVTKLRGHGQHSCSTPAALRAGAGPAGPCHLWRGWGTTGGSDPVCHPSAVLQYCNQLGVRFYCIKFTQVKREKQQRSVEASKRGNAGTPVCCSQLFHSPLAVQSWRKLIRQGKEEGRTFQQVCSDPIGSTQPDKQFRRLRSVLSLGHCRAANASLLGAWDKVWSPFLLAEGCGWSCANPSPW